MTLLDIEPTSPPPSPSPERQQLDRINTAIDQTFEQLETTSQHVMHTIAHVAGIKWYQKSTQQIMSYQRWREIQQQLSKLTYTCGGCDEALMRHLFSLDAIMGDDSIRILRRTSVHRIKHAISRVEILTKYMYHLQYWWKKWIKHENQPEQQQQQQQQQQDQNVPMEPATPTSHTTPTTSASASPAMKSTKVPSKSPQPSSRTIPSSPQLTKAAKAKQSLQKQIKSPSLQTTKSPALRSTSTKTTPRSPALTSRGITSASPSPILPKRHIPIPTQSVPPPPAPAPSSPRFHVRTTSDGLIITATLPDVQRDSLDITVRGHLLRIAGVSQGEPFLREMELPDNSDIDRLDASWQQDADVLRIQVPVIKKQQQQQPPPPPPTRPTYQDDDDDDMDVDQYHPYYYQKPSPYRCAPSYARPTPTYPRRPSVYTQPPRSRSRSRSMFGSPFGFW